MSRSRFAREIPSQMLAVAGFFTVRGYALDDTQLSVRRLLTSTRIPLVGLRRAWIDPTVCKGSLRVMGNGGLFSFTGWFQNKRLGRYRLFATDFRNAVVLKFPDRTIVVTPAEPHAFVEHLHHVIPGLQVGPDAGFA